MSETNDDIRPARYRGAPRTEGESRLETFRRGYYNFDKSTFTGPDGPVWTIPPEEIEVIREEMEVSIMSAWQVRTIQLAGDRVKKIAESINRMDISQKQAYRLVLREVFGIVRALYGDGYLAILRFAWEWKKAKGKP